MKRTVVMILVTTLIVLVTSTALGAVDSVDILIKVLVDKQIITEDDAAAVRAEVANIRQDEEAKKKSFNVSTKRPIKLSGYIQERYTHSDAESFNDYFETKRARLALAGDATDKVDFKLQVDFAGSRKGLTSTTKSALFGKPTLLDAIIGYKLAGDKKFSMGQFKIPFGLENLTSSQYLDTINRSLVTEALVPGRDNGNQGRDIGVQLSSIVPLDEDGVRSIEYYVGVFNGSGINTIEENDRKDPAARLVWNFGPSNAHLGVSYFNGAVGIDSAAHHRTGTELVYVLGPYALKGEYIWGKDTATNKRGWYATLVRQLNAQNQFVVRYDRLDPNTAVDGDSTGTWTFGFNRFLNKDGATRWQVNYERHTEEGVQTKNDLVLAQFQAGF